jgi:hypothetical protein
VQLIALFDSGPRSGGGRWSVQAADTSGQHEVFHSEVIGDGLSSDWISLYSIRKKDFASLLFSGSYVATSDKHPWDAGNNWYVTPLNEGVVVEHQWLQEYQRDKVGWYTWDLVRAVVVLTQWCDAMRKNEAALDAATLHSARLTIEVKNWKPSQSLASLGWRSSEDG